MAVAMEWCVPNKTPLTTITRIVPIFNDVSSTWMAPPKRTLK